jgi:hypothetical protein
VKVQVTLNRTEILAAIGAYLVERGVPVVAGTFRVRVKEGTDTPWVNVNDKSKIEATLEYETESLSSERGAIDSGKTS